uniref:Uncharacterized protein n=1 Tax=Aegilops tauschii TaxID=37682 RepID=M8BNL8_AEGTA
MEQQLADLADAMAKIQEQTAAIQQAVAASSTLVAEIKPAGLARGWRNRWRSCKPIWAAFATRSHRSRATPCSPLSRRIFPR